MDSSKIGMVAIFFVTTMSLAFLTINTVASNVLSTTMYWLIDDLWAMASIIYAFVFIILLFIFLQLFDRLAEDEESREKLKVVIWGLATAIGVVSAAQASMILSLAVTWWVWVLVGSFSFSTLYIFFIRSDQIKGRNFSNFEEDSPVDA